MGCLYNGYMSDNQTWPTTSIGITRLTSGYLSFDLVAAKNPFLNVKISPLE